MFIKQKATGRNFSPLCLRKCTWVQAADWGSNQITDISRLAVKSIIKQILCAVFGLAAVWLLCLAVFNLVLIFYRLSDYSITNRIHWYYLCCNWPRRLGEWPNHLSRWSGIIRWCQCCGCHSVSTCYVKGWSNVAGPIQMGSSVFVCAVTHSWTVRCLVPLMSFARPPFFGRSIKCMCLWPWSSSSGGRSCVCVCVPSVSRVLLWSSVAAATQQMFPCRRGAITTANS